MNKKLQDFLAANEDSKESVKDLLFGFIMFKQLGRSNDFDYAIIGGVKNDIPIDICIEIWNENEEVTCLKELGVREEEIYLEVLFLLRRYYYDFPSTTTIANLAPIYTKIHNMNKSFDEKQKEFKEKLKDLNDYLEEI
jgi:hypothetical protein